MTTPVPGGGGAPVFPPIDPFAPPTTTTPPVVGDSIASISRNMQTIIGFAHAIGLPKSELEEAIKLAQDAGAKARLPFYNAIVVQALNLATFSEALSYAAPLMETICDQNSANLAALQASLNAYNNSTVPADQAAIATINAAIDAYNAGGSSANFTTAVTAWNSYVTTRNSSPAVTGGNAAINSFNDQTTEPGGINDQIIGVNLNTAATYGSGLAQFQTQDTFPSIAPLPTITLPVPGPPVSHIPATQTFTPTTTIDPNITDAKAYIQQIITPFYVALLPMFIFNLSLLAMQSNFTFGNLISFDGKPINIPQAFIDLVSNPNFNASGGGIGTGTGVPLALMMAVLSEPLLTSVLASSIFLNELANQASNSVSLNPFTSRSERRAARQLARQIGLLATALASQMGLLSVNTAVRLLGGSLAGIDPRSSLAAVAIGLAVVSELSAAITGGVLREGVQGLLSQQFPGLSANSLGSLSIQLAVVAELFLLQLGTLQLALALGSPQLLAQLLGAGTNIGLEGLVSGQLAFSSSLVNGQNRQDLADILTNNLGINQDVASRAIQNIISNDFANASALNVFLLAFFAQNGLNTNQAVAAALLAVAFVNSEITGQNVLGLNFNAQLIAGTVLANALILGILGNNGGELNGRQLRRELVRELRNQGLSPSDALLAATTLLASFNPVTALLSDGALSARLLALVGALGGSSLLGQELVAALLGGGPNPSVRELLRDRIGGLAALNDNNVTAGLRDLLKEFLTPQAETLGLARLLGDPATLVLFIGAGETPSTQSGVAPGVRPYDTQSVDIPV